MKINTLGLTILAATLVQPALASRSVISPNTSSQIMVTYAISQDMQLTDADGKAVTLKQNGLMVEAGEDTSRLNPTDLKNRTLESIRIDYDSKGKKSFLSLLSPRRSALNAPFREIHFTLPQQIQIGADGRPLGIENVVASADQTGQGVGVEIKMSAPGEWEPYEYDTTASCSIPMTRVECDWVDVEDARGPEPRGPGRGDGDHNGGDHDGRGNDHDNRGGDHDGRGNDHDNRGGDHDGRGHDHDNHGWDGDHDGHHEHHYHKERVCHDVVYYIPGSQSDHVSGQRKTDGYTVNVGALNMGFSFHYDNASHDYGVCYPL